jgi:methylphosphotriester-DNA--protein-cysteine methyltransferase
MADMQLDYAVPDARLSNYVTLFYRFRSDLPVFEETERADRAQMRFVLHDGGGEYSFPDGLAQRAMDVHIVGPTTGPRIIRADCPVHVFGAGITPCGWAALVGSDASSMVNRLVDAADLFGKRVIEAREALRAAPDLAAMEAIAATLLRELIRDSGGETLRFVRQVDDWLKASTSPKIESLIAATVLSRRQIERKCNRLYGMPPKLLARKYRALRAAVACILDQDQAHDGFYDQSHLIRDVREFTGLTPRQLKSQPGLIASLSVGLRHNLSGRMDPLVSDA